MHFIHDSTGRFARRVAVAATAITACVCVACGQSPTETDSDTVTVDHTSPVDAGDLPMIRLRQVFSQVSFERPVQITHAGDGSDRLFILEQRAGRVRVIPNESSASEAKVFLDIGDRVFMGHNEEGLLSIAFHPEYEDNGRFYLWYTAGNRRDRRMVLSRFTVSSDDADRADPESEQVILEVEQPWGNHNGGTVLFGPDGYLYLSIGDGGAANDPHGHGQNLSTLLGSIIRIDVDNAGDDRPYAIPEDNPFVDREGARGEIWALGLRNVWRMSFDRETGDLWAADVGQNAWEMVYLIERGGNYGWNINEGSQPFRPNVEPATEPLIDPVIEYSHRQGRSITGGHVYRGSMNEQLRGAYLYADYVSGRIWALRMEDGVVTANREVLDTSRRPYVTSFGEDEAGEMYICTFEHLDGRGGSNGRIFRIVDE